MVAKLAYYTGKYGLMHAIGSYAGRISPSFWSLAGPALTRSYLQRWTETTETRILNLGGGSHSLGGCLTVDIDPRADAYVDATKPLPFASSSLHGVFCEEAIEHIDLAHGNQLVSECWRILVPGGVLRLTTPDLNWFANRILTEPTAWLETNSIFYEHRHRCLYTPAALQQLCIDNGFINLKLSSYRDGTSKLGYLDSHADRYRHPPEMSQYLEAHKPDDRMKFPRVITSP